MSSRLSPFPRSMVGLGLLGMLACFQPGDASAQTASAQTASPQAASPQAASPQIMLLEASDPTTPEARSWQRRVRASLSRGEPNAVAALALISPDLSAWVMAQHRVTGFEASRLAVFEELSASLLAARQAAAQLNEAQALAILSRARQHAEANLNLPGMSHWYAELSVAQALVASQSQMPALADTALRHAATLDSTRQLRPGEAHPTLVARSRALRSEVLNGPQGQFDLEVDWPDAEIFLDDISQGPAPAAMEARVGLHLLRVEAPGALSWAGLVQVFAGRRAPMRVLLSPTPLLRRARALETLTPAALEGSPAGLRALGQALQAFEVSASQAPPILLLPLIGPAPGERALLIRCDSELGCARAYPLEAGAPLGISALSSNAPTETLASALTWLHASRQDADDDPREPPWWSHWAPWSAGGVLLSVGAAAIVAAALGDQGPGPLSVQVDSSMLPTGATP